MLPIDQKVKRKEEKTGNRRTGRARRQMKESVDSGIAHARVESSEPPPDTIKLDN